MSDPEYVVSTVMSLATVQMSQSGAVAGAGKADVKVKD